MIRARVDLRQADGMCSAPFMGDDGRAVAWLELGGPAEVARFGSPEDLFVLAAGVTAAADEAAELRRVAELVAAAGMTERLAG